MGILIDSGLTTEANIIKNETALQANTADRVGQMFIDMIDSKVSLTNPRVYVALLNQTGTSAPVATVMRNTLSGAIVWSRTSAGQYEGVLASNFTANKTWIPGPYGSSIFPVNGGSDFQFFAINVINTGQVRVFSKVGPSGTLVGTDGLLVDFPIEIRVYS